MTASRPATRGGLAGDLALAAVPAAIFIAADLFVSRFAGDYGEFPGIDQYRWALNAGVLLRFAGLFGAVIVVWGTLRSRSAPHWVLALAIMSGPLAYSSVEFVRVQQFFPIGQAAYYAVNPLVIAGLGSQIAAAAVAEANWRFWRRRRGSEVPRPVTWRLAAVAVTGWAVLYTTVLWHGGVYWFYVYQQGYLALFGP